jgi:outer membrane biosynthesis protein TonB
MKRLLLVLCAAVLAGACASAQAKVKSPVDHPPMDVPPPPPRVLEPIAQPAPPPEPVPDLPATPTTTRPRQQAPREPPKPVETKPETPPVKTAPATPPQAAPQVPPLRTSATPDDAAARQVREIIERASGSLNRVDYGHLNKQQKSQYDSVKLFIKQSEESLKAQNYEFARNLADKADRIAKELAPK